MRHHRNDAAIVAASDWRPLIDAIAPLAERIVPQMDNPDDPLLRYETEL